MKLVFLEDVPNVAKAGEVKEVADGFGRNFLLPQKLAVVATPAELKKVEGQRQAEVRRQARGEQESEALAERLRSMTLVFKVRAGAKDRLYGSITSSDIAQEIKRLSGHDIDKRKIELEESIHELGNFRVSIRLTKNVVAAIEVFVEAEQE